MRKLIIIIFAASSLVAMAIAGPAMATAPERFHDSGSGSEPGFIHCDGYDIDLYTTGSEDFTVYFDDAGEVIKVLVRSRATDIFTNTVSGKTVVNRGVFQQLFVRIDGTDEFTHSLTGFRFMGTTPGRGLVLQDVGRIEYRGDEEEIIFLAGQHHVPEGPGAEEVFCAALA
jgi:hypothetical protein